MSSDHNNGQLRRHRYCLVAMLMHGPATQAELASASGMGAWAVQKNLQAMLQAGIVYVLGLRRPRLPDGSRGRAQRVYALQAKPFELPNSSERLPELEP